MDIGEQRDFLVLLKTLADEQRLMMVSLMSEREQTVTELAEQLGISEPTVSHHVRKLHNVGLLNLRMSGTYRYYRLNPRGVEKLRRYISEIDQPITAAQRESSDVAWIEALPFEAAAKKYLRDNTQDGRLTQLPTKEKNWLIVLRWLATRFEPGMRYTERQVNAILTEIHADYATLRRNLVEYGFMQRQRGGGDYWLVPEDAPAAEPRQTQES